MNGTAVAAPFRRCVVIVFAVFLIPAASFGADNAVKLLTLDEALRIASERNRDIRKASEFRRQVEGRYVEERAAALPQVTITSGISRNRDTGCIRVRGSIHRRRAENRTHHDQRHFYRVRRPDRQWRSQRDNRRI